MVTRQLPFPALLKLFSDPTRLRMLALLDREELSVGELSRAVGMAQSRVSNHLRILRESGLLSERHVGASTYLRLGAPGEVATPAGRLWGAFSDEVSGLPEHRADVIRLESVLAERGGANFFDRVAGDWDKIAGDFDTGQARQRAAVHLLPGRLRVADLGCGQGYFAETFRDLGAQVLCVDRSGPMLEEAKRSLGSGSGSSGIDFILGELDSLPIVGGSLDGAVMGMVLHHLESPGGAFVEMRRVLRPGGAAVVVELAPHREDWMRDKLGDRHLGLEASDVVAALERAGFENVVLDPVKDRYCPVGPDGKGVPLALYIARGRVPRSSN